MSTDCVVVMAIDVMFDALDNDHCNPVWGDPSAKRLICSAAEYWIAELEVEFHGVYV